MALTSKDLRPNPDQITVADLNVKQVAYSVAWSLPWILPSDLLEIGGETDWGWREGCV